MTLQESAERAVLPWNSIDAESAMFDALPQQSIDVCLMCHHCASHCENCGEWRDEKRGGRPRKEIDYVRLSELLHLRLCNREICAALGVSLTTLKNAFRAIT